MNTLPAATMRLIKAVCSLLDTDPDDPLYYERARGLLELCRRAIDALPAAETEAGEAATPPSVPVRGDLGPRIAWLSANGKGVRATARILGVNPSTVSRTLRRQQDRARRAHDASRARANLSGGAEGAGTGTDPL
ncbi:MAG TPA: helix-turn-helix domain-containing protein [Casimicrobiaceae bacterium]|nr:helix-turn-helix domain-containing protein [Casimicrobiaceae bacterium]